MHMRKLYGLVVHVEGESAFIVHFYIVNTINAKCFYSDFSRVISLLEVFCVFIRSLAGSFVCMKLLFELNN